MDKTITERLECRCTPGKVYASKSTLKAHFRCQRHQLYEATAEAHKLRCDLKTIEHKLAGLEHQIAVYKSLVMELYSSHSVPIEKQLIEL